MEILLEPTSNKLMVGKVVKETESTQQYVLLSLWSTGFKDPHNTDADVAFDAKANENEVHVFLSSSIQLKKHDEKAKREAKGKSPIDLSTGVRDLRDEFEEFSVNSTNRVNAASAPVTNVGPNPTNNTNNFNAVSYSDNVVSLNFEIGGKSSFVDPSQYHEEGIDYEEVFAPVARIEAIRLFLAYASFIGFMVYQIDVKTAFLYGTIEEEVYVFQPPRFEDPDYPDKVYKVVKALYGLHQAHRAWYETLANYLLKNGFQRGKIDQTLFIKKQNDDILLVRDKFQMSSMGELTFFLGLQVKKKDDGIFISQEKYVAEILRKFGLTDSKSASTPIDTEKPLLKDLDDEDVDVHIYRHIITGVSYTINVVWSDERCCLLNAARSQIVDFLNAHTIQYALMVNPPIYVSCIKQFWASVLVKKTNDVVKLQALIDRKKVVITEDTIRQALRLDDAYGVECQPNEEIFAELACMGYEKPPPKLTFYKAFFSAQ
nr:putative ribonuclease H-like domain-containing protein [Tanacetum cinerariifolium]